jgi:hypothetical protein
MGRRVRCRFVHLSARMVVGLGRNRQGRRETTTTCEAWSSRRSLGRSCWRQKGTAGSSSLRLQRSLRRGAVRGEWTVPSDKLGYRNSQAGSRKPARGASCRIRAHDVSCLALTG